MHASQISATTTLILLLTTAPGAQSTRGAVPLEAADCSRTHVMFGEYQVAHAVQHVVVPLSAGTLDLEPGGNGGVRIEKGSGSNYSITACIAAGAASFDRARRAADAVRLAIDGSRVRVVNTGEAERWNVQLIVEAPSNARIAVETSNGPISISGVEGTFTARASNGPIAVEDVAGRVDAVAVNGPVSVSGSRGTFDVETQNGPISVDLQGRRWDGELNARAQNGPLTVNVPENYVSGVEVRSSSRSPWTCRLAACGAGERSWDGGGRTLRLGRDPVVVRLSTVNGPVVVQN